MRSTLSNPTRWPSGFDIAEMAARIRLCVTGPDVSMAAPTPMAHRLLALLAVVLLGGCSTPYPAAADQYQLAMTQGGYDDACEVAQGARADEPSRILWQLELAAAQRAAGDLTGSVRTLEETERAFRAADAGPQLALGEEGLATLSNPYQLRYPGRNVDRIYAAVYQALGQLELGERERARVSLTRSLFRQEDARRRQAEAAAAASREAETAAREDTEFARRLDDPALAEAREAVRRGFRKGTGDARNPFAVWLNGVYYLRTAEGVSDLERARKALESAQSLAPGNPHIAEDLRLAESATQAPVVEAGRSCVYIVHEEGLAPAWSEQILTLPLIYGDIRAPMVAVALPTLVPGIASERPTEAMLPGQPTVRLAPLADIDAIVHEEFQLEYPRARNRAIASATMKALAGYLANRAAQDEARRSGGGSVLAGVTLLATNLYGVSSARADLRRWSSLPREVRMARVTTARGAVLRVAGGSIQGEAGCRLPAASCVLVTIRSISPEAPPIIRTSILRP